MKESTFYKNLKDYLESKGYIVWSFTDRFTEGIPDVYCAKDGESHWYELKVSNKRPGQTIDFKDNGNERGFTRSQAIKIYKLREQDIDAWGLVYLPYAQVTLKVPPESMDKKYGFEEAIKTFEKHPFK